MILKVVAVSPGDGFGRGVRAFVEATGAPPEALSWLLRLSREAESWRAAGADEATAAPPLPVLLAPGRGLDR